MPTAASSALALFETEAKAAEVAELSFRNDVAREIAARERRRQFAYRRLDLIDTLVKAVRGSETGDEARAAGRQALMRALGWNTETEARKSVLAAWTPVVEATWRDTRAETAPDSGETVVQAMRAFEDWYLAETGSPLLAAFDVELPELPVVEF